MPTRSHSEFLFVSYKCSAPQKFCLSEMWPFKKHVHIIQTNSQNHICLWRFRLCTNRNRSLNIGKFVLNFETKSISTYIEASEMCDTLTEIELFQLSVKFRKQDQKNSWKVIRIFVFARPHLFQKSRMFVYLDMQNGKCTVVWTPLNLLQFWTIFFVVF